MPKLTRQIKQGTVTLEEYDDGQIRASIDTFAISMAASRREGDDLLAVHEADAAPSHTGDEIEAQKYGFEQAREKWPESEGWSHNVRVKKITFSFDFGQIGEQSTIPPPPAP